MTTKTFSGKKLYLNNGSRQRVVNIAVENNEFLKRKCVSSFVSDKTIRRNAAIFILVN